MAGNSHASVQFLTQTRAYNSDKYEGLVMPMEGKFNKTVKTSVNQNDCLALSDDEDEASSDVSSSTGPIFDPIESIRPHSLAHPELRFSETIGKQLKACEQLKYSKKQFCQDKASFGKGIENQVAQKSASKLNWDFKSNQFSNLVSLESPNVAVMKHRMHKHDVPQHITVSKTTNHIEPDIMMFYSGDLQKETPSLPSIPKIKLETIKQPVETINDIAERLRCHNISCHSFN